MLALTTGDTAKPPLLLKKLGAETVQRCGTVVGEHHRDRLIVSERQRCFDTDPPLDRVCDLASGLGVALTFKSLRKRTSNGAPSRTPAILIVSTLPD